MQKHQLIEGVESATCNLEANTVCDTFHFVFQAVDSQIQVRGFHAIPVKYRDDQPQLLAEKIGNILDTVKDGVFLTAIWVVHNGMTIQEIVDQHITKEQIEETSSQIAPLIRIQLTKKNGKITTKYLA